MAVVSHDKLHCILKVKYLEVLLLLFNNVCLARVMFCDKYKIQGLEVPSASYF